MTTMEKGDTFVKYLKENDNRFKQTEQKSHSCHLLPFLVSYNSFSSAICSMCNVPAVFRLCVCVQTASVNKNYCHAQPLRRVTPLELPKDKWFQLCHAMLVWPRAFSANRVQLTLRSFTGRRLLTQKFCLLGHYPHGVRWQLSAIASVVRDHTPIVITWLATVIEVIQVMIDADHVSIGFDWSQQLGDVSRNFSGFSHC